MHPDAAPVEKEGGSNLDLLNASHEFRITVWDARFSAGADFIVAMISSIMAAPGLPKTLRRRR